MPFILKRAKYVHICVLPEDNNGEPITGGMIWECDLCGMMYKAVKKRKVIVWKKMALATYFKWFASDVDTGRGG